MNIAVDCVKGSVLSCVVVTGREGKCDDDIDDGCCCLTGFTLATGMIDDAALKEFIEDIGADVRLLRVTADAGNVAIDDIGTVDLLVLDMFDNTECWVTEGCDIKILGEDNAMP